MSSNESLVISFRFKEGEDYSERISSSLDIVLKDLHSKGLLSDEEYGRRVSKEK